MNALFDSIVQLFQYICKLTGLQYSELNILVYCLLIPLSWAVIVVFRHRKYLLLLALHIVSVYCYVSFRGELNIWSRQFYAKNVAYLEFFGKNTPQGYVYISLVIGLLVPFLMYGLLFFANKTRLLWIYVCFVIALLAYQLFVLCY